jgi:hypothetical protein
MAKIYDHQLMKMAADMGVNNLKEMLDRGPIYEIRPSLDHYNRYLIWCDPHPLASTYQEYLPANWVR